MPVARLNPGFRGDWTPLVLAISQAIEILEGKPHRSFEIRFFGDEDSPKVAVNGAWEKGRGIVFHIPETLFIKNTLTKAQETSLLLAGWRRSPSKERISYIYAIHGKLRSDFLAGSVVDAVREILGDYPDSWFELLVDGQTITKVNSKLFEAGEEISGRFRVKL